MRYLWYLPIFAIICFTALVNCAGEKKSNSAHNSENNQNYRLQKQDSIALTAVFDKVNHDFGTIRRGEEVSVRFYFTNKGKQPLVVERVKTGCGCTLGIIPREPVISGQRDFVEVLFNTSGRKGMQFQEIKVFFTQNSEPISLTFTARIQEK